jgi:class 3 adenylate cyclase/tetratricopeptide (TPR) repeat protein
MARDIGEWLEGLGLSRYAEAFADNEIDMHALPHITEEDLKEIGVALGARRQLLAKIGELGDLNAPGAATGGSDEGSVANEAQRRQLTVMFCDLVGSTALSTRHDPEDYREVIRAYQDACAGVITRFGGFVAKYMGDGILAYFGWPQAREDDAGRAISAGLGLIEAIADLTPLAGETNPFAVRIGIATGPVVVGDIVGEGAAQEAAVTGETPNLAARLQGIAEPNTVIVAATTRTLAGGQFTYDALGGQLLKGIDGETQVWRAISERRIESRFAAAHAAELTPLVGRKEELELLTRRWEQAKAGEGQVILLSAEPGIGKSRLSQALQDRIGDEAHVKLLYQCSPHHTNSALYPIISQIEHAAEFEAGDTAEEKLDKLEVLLELAGQPPANVVVPLIASLLAIPAAERHPLPDLTPQQQKEQILSALNAQLVGLADQKPVLFIFEDLHWSDPTSLEFLELIVAQVEKLRAMAVFTYRPEFISPWTGAPHVTLQALNRLTARDCRAIAEGLSADVALPEEVIAQLIEKTDGVPLFVEELTRSVLDSQANVGTTKGEVSASQSVDIVIPATLQDALEARLDRSPAVREVAQTGAAIGREFQYNLLAQIISLPESDLGPALDDLSQTGLIFVRGTPPEASYVFKHALVQDTAYDSMVRSKRQGIHASIAEALINLQPETVETKPELLAHHFTEAGLLEDAIDWWTSAGRAAAARSANSESVALLERGLDLVTKLPASEARDQRELALHIALMAPLIAVKGQTSPELEAAFNRALELCDTIDAPDEMFRAMYAKWLFHSLGGQHATAFNQAEDMLRLAERTSDGEALLMGHNLLGRSLFLMGRTLEGLDHLNQMLAMFDRQRHGHLMVAYGQDPAAIVEGYRAMALAVLGQPDAAKAAGERTITNVFELGHVNSIGPTLCMCGIIAAVIRADYADMRQVCEQFQSITSQHDIPIWKAWEQIASAIAEVDVDPSTRTVNDLRVSIDHLATQMHGHGVFSPLLMHSLGQGYLSIGETAKTLETVSAGLKLIEASEERWFESQLHRLRGAALASADDPGENAKAEASMRKAIELAKSGGAKLFELRGATSLARYLHDGGRTTEACELLVPLYGWFDEGFDTPDLEEAKALLDEIS